MPDLNPPRSTTGSAVRWIVGTALWALLLAVLIFVVPVEKKTFDELGLALPTVTTAVIDISMWFADWWWVFTPAFVTAALVAGLITYLVRHRTDNRFLMACWTLVLIGVPLALHAVTAYSLVQPHMKLKEGLSK